MRLSDVLSKEPSDEYKQVDGFLEKKLKIGQNRKIDIGTIALSFYCKTCDDSITFFSDSKNLMCIGVDEFVVSIDTVLRCPRCNATIPTWFLIECGNKTTMISQYPNVKILKRTFRISDKVLYNNEKFEKYSELIEKANQAYNDELGAGSIIYLRKIYEQIIIEMAKITEVSLTNITGKRKNFSDLVKEVNSKKLIVPEEFSKDGYRLFSELSNVIHGEFDEKIALKQYPAFFRLVKGILDKIKNNKEIMQALEELQWNIKE